MHFTVPSPLYRLLRDPERGEGMRDRMYLDRKGIVTVGVGMALLSEQAVRRFNWNVPDDEAVRQWRQIAAQGRRLAASGTRITNEARSTARTTEADVQRLFPVFLRSVFVPRLREQFPHWNLFPGDAQMGALLHVWGLGQNALRPESRWQNYKVAVLDINWDRAAEESIYHPIRPCRERDLRMLFHNAARVEIARREQPSFDLRRVFFPGVVTYMSPNRWYGLAAYQQRHPGQW